MAKPSPFVYVKSICEKKYEYDLIGYVPFIVNRCFAFHLDTILLAEEMNQAHRISPWLQYEFYYYAVRKGKRFGFPPKPQEYDNVELIQEYYGYSRLKALQALRILTKEQISDIMKMKNIGGQ